MNQSELTIIIPFCNEKYEVEDTFMSIREHFRYGEADRATLSILLIYIHLFCYAQGEQSAGGSSRVPYLLIYRDSANSFIRNSGY